MAVGVRHQLIRLLAGGVEEVVTSLSWKGRLRFRRTPNCLRHRQGFRRRDGGNLQQMAETHKIALDVSSRVLGSNEPRPEQPG